ncbi:MAG: flagellar biosynthesis anti-sigma factor FlgM [Deltaproteobacteria bacterium]|nr:flagellar biosynthesis anti-sigma factor FlgM [Deltaproteobacteria bacterium]
MKVGDKKTQPVADAVVNRITGGSLPAVDAMARPSQPDMVDISTEAKELSKARKLLDAIPEIRFEKVNSLKTDIRNNTYSVDTEKVVVRLIERAIRDALYTKGKP